MKSLTKLFPVAFLAFVAAVFQVPGFKETHERSFSITPETFTPVSPELVITAPEPEPEIVKPDPEPEFTAKPEIIENPWPDVSHTGPKPPPRAKKLPNFETAPLGKGFVAVINETHSFDELIKQAFTKEKGDALIDIHFNKYKKQHSGPLILTTKDGLPLAKALQREFIEIYEEEGWIYDKEFDVRQQKNLALITAGNKKNKAILISEFGYVDDPNNPIGEYIQTVEGAKRIARAFRNAARGLNYSKIILAAGHHGNRGSSGATYKGFHETTFAFNVINSLFNLHHPEPTGNPPLEYEHYQPKPPVIEPETLSLRSPAIEADSEIEEWIPEATASTGYLSPPVSASENSKPGFFSRFRVSIQERTSKRVPVKKACKT